MRSCVHSYSQGVGEAGPHGMGKGQFPEGKRGAEHTNITDVYYLISWLFLFLVALLPGEDNNFLVGL